VYDFEQDKVCMDGGTEANLRLGKMKIDKEVTLLLWRIEGGLDHPSKEEIWKLRATRGRMDKYRRRGFMIVDAATRWREPLAPLAAAGRANVLRWLASLRQPVRSGTHNQTAFALTLLHDAAATPADAELEAAVRRQALALYLADAAGALAFEPSGEDFLSPALMQADLMRRVLPQREFVGWLARFLPGVPLQADGHWLPCAEVADEADGKAVHLHGLNLSRAWNLRNIAAALPREDVRRAALESAGERHAEAGLKAALACRHYSGDHWLPTFAGYLLTESLAA
jgi:hypothetical protein